MNPQTARFLIVDDKPDEGERIAHALWDAKLPVLFVPFDEERLADWDIRYTGVRAIFMDINLLQDGPPGPKDYGAVQNTIETLLDDRNGPYVLILWSGYTEKSQELFNYLCERLPHGKKPLWWAPLDKSPYILDRQLVSDLADAATLLDSVGENADAIPVDSDKAAVAEGPTDSEEIRTADPSIDSEVEKAVATPETLRDVVRKLLETHTHLGCLTAWERGIHQGVSDVLHTISDIAVTEGTQYSDDKLGGLLYELAKAESGKSLERCNFISSLHEVLGALLRDRLRLDKPYEFELAECSSTDIPYWKQKINTMLHLDRTGLYGQVSRPGAVFSYPSQASILSVPKVADEALFIRKNFFREINEDDKRKAEKEQRQLEISTRCKLHLIDVTPPCDHAQMKAVWRRFVVAAKIQSDHKAVINYADYLYLLPELQTDDQSFFLLANSKLLLSIEDSTEVLSQLGECRGRIREQMLTDMIGWLSRQVSRIGVTSL